MIYKKGAVNFGDFTFASKIKNFYCIFLALLHASDPAASAARTLYCSLVQYNRLRAYVMQTTMLLQQQVAVSD